MADRCAPFPNAGLARAEIDVGLRQHMLRVYNYMGRGLVLTGTAEQIEEAKKLAREWKPKVMCSGLTGGGPRDRASRRHCLWHVSTSASECPVMVAISGTSQPASARRVTAEPRIVERKIVGYVRFRARLAPARAEAILGPRRIVRGGEDRGRHARSPVERGLERSVDRNLDLSAFAFPLTQPNKLTTIGRPWQHQQVTLPLPRP
jgi:hypothetical protein